MSTYTVDHTTRTVTCGKCPGAPRWLEFTQRRPDTPTITLTCPICGRSRTFNATTLTELEEPTMTTADGDDIPTENIGQQIARALAIDPETTSTITITPEGGELVTVTVEMHRTITIDDELGKRIVTILGNYRLVPLESATLPPPPPPRCTSRAPRIVPTHIDPITEAQFSIAPQCVLPEGHDGWHSDGAHPLPMQWTEHLAR